MIITIPINEQMVEASKSNWKIVEMAKIAKLAINAFVKDLQISNSRYSPLFANDNLVINDSKAKVRRRIGQEPDAQ